MIKKKIVITFMVIYLIVTLSVFSHSALLSYFVSQLAPATAAATTGGANVAAKIAATAAAGSASKWVTLFVPGAGLAKIGALGLAIGLTIAGDYIYDECKEWFDAQKIDREGKKTVIETTPQGYDPTGLKDRNNPVSPTGGLPITDAAIPAYTMIKYIKYGYYTSYAAAQAALNVEPVEAWICENFAPSDAYVTCGPPAQAKTTLITTNQLNRLPTGFPISGTVAGINLDKVSAIGFVRGYNTTGSKTAFCFLYFYPKNGVPTENREYKKQLTKEELEALMAANMTNALAEGILREAARILAGSDFKAAAPSNYTNITNVLNNAVSTQNKTDVETAIPESVDTAVESSKADVTAAIIAALKAQGLSASQIAAAIAAVTAASAGGLTVDGLNSALSSAGLTAAQIAAAVAAAAPALTQTNVKTAVKEAIDDETDVTIPIDPTISLPTKLSLTTIMNDFWTSVQGLPIFNVLNGITIQTSGTSNLCIDLPAAYGGNRCYNGANVQDELNMIGTAILGLTTVISFIGVFKG